MVLARVTGFVWATKRSKKLSGMKLLIVKPYFLYDPPFSCDHIVAVDLAEGVHAGIGDDVIVSFGYPARMVAGDDNLPVEAAVIGVVDSVEVTEESLFDPILPFNPWAIDSPHGLRVTTRSEWSEPRVDTEDRGFSGGD